MVVKLSIFCTQRFEDVFNNHFPAAKDRPQFSASLRHAADFGGRPGDVHIWQRDSRDHEIKAMVAERQRLAFSANKEHSRS
jgi:hypothetical protein